ncbi:MAG: ankyrin repeat domain-containing protein [Pseudomonadota bacterium]
MIIASYQGHEEIVRMLIDNASNPLYRSPTELGEGTAFHYALQQDHQSISQYLYNISAEKKAIETQKDLKDAAESLSNLHETIESLSQKVGTLEQKDTTQREQLNALVTETFFFVEGLFAKRIKGQGKRCFQRTSKCKSLL